MAGIELGRRVSNEHARPTHSRSPTVSELQRIGELTAARIHVTDAIVAEGKGYRGSWLIKGDALLACDLTKARFVHANTTKRTATLRLPRPHVTSARVDHEKTRTWSVERNTWLPWKGGDQDAFRAAAMAQAQRLVESAAASEQHLAPARTQTEHLFHQMCEPTDWTITMDDWTITIAWERRTSQPHQNGAMPMSKRNPMDDHAVPAPLL